MLQIKVKVEIRGGLVREVNHYEARTINGQSMPARDWVKVYYNAELDGQPCIVRIDEGKYKDYPKELKRGQNALVTFGQLDVQSDVSSLKAINIEPCK